MPKTRKPKRKVPVTVRKGKRSGTRTPGPSGSSKPAATRKVIRRFHILHKRQAQLQKFLEGDSVELSRQAKDAREELQAIEQEISDMGGLEAYQKMSVIGQGNDRGGGSEKVLLEFLEELGYPKDLNEGQRWRVLEVGALKPDNYASCSSWMDVTPIDLHSRHPDISEQDFLQLDEEENKEKWDVISLSLVVNFVPEPKDRGRMLQMAHAMLRPNQYLFLALPLPCILNSRYVTPEHLQGLMTTLSYTEVKKRWKEGGKMAYWLYQKTESDKDKPDSEFAPYRKKAVVRSGNRNNFSILL
ncbi:nucleolus protein [Irpex rosettiformis]|uniref:Nucleolus protein n=1 Tax=Irpex rosettiformis TaxID=378272 RepID=A0ACB8TTR3_9APHY|nr:nucleolus protein [Irpex rosettiformis]